MTTTTPTVHRLGPDPVVLRELNVVRSVHMAPRMMRVTLGGEQLDGFTSAASDDHVVLFFLREDQAVPTSEDPNRRPIWDERPPTRDYTPRRHDPASGELDIEFVLHGDGVASTWAEQARAGDRIAIAGPRSSVVPDGFPHYLLIGDESALPSIARRLEELPPTTSAQVFLEVQSEADQMELATGDDVNITWCHRGDAPPGSSSVLLDAVRGAELAVGDLYTCVAAETDVVRRLRHHLLGDRGLTAAHTRFSGYWKLGRT